MFQPPPVACFDLNDAPAAASLEALAASAHGPDQSFLLYPETVIENPSAAFGDLWHFPEGHPSHHKYRPGPMISAAVAVRSMTGALVHPGSGLVFDRAGRVLTDSAHAEYYRDRSWTRARRLLSLGAKLAVQLAAAAPGAGSRPITLYANHGGYTVFAHLMGETIPLTRLFSPWLGSGEMRLLMPRADSSAMPDRLLDLAGLSPTVQTRPDGPFVWIDGAIVASTCSSTPTFNPGPLHHDFARAIKARIPHRAGSRRLFLTRRGERTTQRRDLANEDALMAALAPMGFEAVNPGLLAPREQVALFAEAECLVAVMGSVWANLIYAEPGTLVVDLLPEHKAAARDRFGMHCAKSMGLPYILILTPSEGPSPGDITVTADVPLVADRVRRGLERVRALGLR